MKDLLVGILLIGIIAGVAFLLGYPVLPAGWTTPWRTPAAPTALRTVRLAAPRTAEARPGGPLEAQRLLRDGRFGELTTRVEAAITAARADVAHEAGLADVLRAFGVPDPAVGGHVDAWAAAAPASAAPRLARAEHLLAAAGAPPGAPAEADGALHGHLAMAALAARDALRVAPGLTEAHAMLIRTAAGAGDVPECIRLGVEALAATPASARVRMALAHCLLPGRGGSYEMVDALAAEAAPHVPARPALRVLAGFGAWDRGRAAAATGALEDAIALQAEALTAADHWEFRVARARALADLGRPIEALADLDHAVALRPEDPEVLVPRAEVLAILGRVQSAVADVSLVEEMDPASAGLAAFRRRELARAAAEGARALDAHGDPRTAVRRLTNAIMLTGGDAEVFHLRGRAHLRALDEERALPDFLDAIRLDARHVPSYRGAGALLGKRGAWGEVVALWSRYLALEPESAEALFGRASAHRRLGDAAAAAADAGAACRLGLGEACELADAAGG